MTLKPCPFCGQRKLTQFTVSKDWGRSFVQCWNCNSAGPFSCSANGARMQWNRRAGNKKGGEGE